MAQQHRLCFVIADGGHARLAWPAADNAPRTVEALDSATLRKASHDLGSDRPGRTFESASPARHAYTPRHDPHDLEKTRFARLVAERVTRDAAEGVFDELVVVAPPHVLHDLTEALDPPTRAKLIGTLAKDLVNVPDHELWPHLKEWVRPVHRA